MKRRGEETAMQKLRNQVIVTIGLVVFVGIPSYFLAMGTFRWMSGAWFEVNFYHWGVWLAIGVTTLVYAILILMVLVQMVLGFMLALKR